MPEPERSERPKVTRMTDYQGNSNKSKDGPTSGPGEQKKVEKVVTGEVTLAKKSFAKRTRESVIASDARSLGDYLFWGLLIPTIKNAIVDMATRGIERAIYGDKAIRTRDNIRGREGRTTYYPYNQARDPIGRSREGRAIEARYTERRPSDRETYIMSTREDADRVLDEMNEVIELQGFATVAMLKELIGFPSTHVDWKFGWTTLVGVQSHQVSEGYLIDFPKPVQV